MRPVQRVLGDEARIGVEIGGLRDLRIIRVLGALFEDVLGPEAIADVGVGSVKNLGCYAASWIGWWPKRPSSSAALT
jgi:hypothetical protein